jgi:hypothetical protein
MKASDAFPSKYIAAADLNDKDVVVKITHVTTEEIGNKQKFICYFAGGKKGLVLNKTNWNSIVRITGMEDSDDWTGMEICLFPTMVDFQGDSVPAVRVKAARKAPARDPISTSPKRMTGGISDTQLASGDPRDDDGTVPF